MHCQRNEKTGLWGVRDPNRGLFEARDTRSRSFMNITSTSTSQRIVPLDGPLQGAGSPIFDQSGRLIAVQSQ